MGSGDFRPCHTVEISDHVTMIPMANPMYTYSLKWSLNLNLSVH